MILQRRFGRRTHTWGTQRGAAAVEFSLVSVLLFLILFGILQYGLYFNGSLKAHQGVREAARMAVVQNPPPECSASTGWSAIACTAEKSIGGSPDDTYVNASAPDGWTKGNMLHFCVLVRSGSDFGMLPMPNDGFVRVHLHMSIESADPKPVGAGAHETPPAGQDWSWCT